MNDCEEIEVTSRSRDFESGELLPTDPTSVFPNTEQATTTKILARTLVSPEGRFYLRELQECSSGIVELVSGPSPDRQRHDLFFGHCTQCSIL